MKQHPTTKAPRLITCDTPDLPPEFAVVDGPNIYEASNQAKMIFMGYPEVSLVVWPAMSLPSDQLEDAQEKSALQAAVHELSCRVQELTLKVKTNVKLSPSFWSVSHTDEPFDISLHNHFEFIADSTGNEVESLRDWHDDTYDFAEAISEEFNARELMLTTRFRSAACPDYDGLHTDCGLRSHSLRILRVVDGDTTRFYGHDDVAAFRYHKGATSALLKPDAQPWILKPWDVAFVSQKVVHQAPGNAGSGRRALEVYDLRSADEFIASADRPLMRRLLGRRPAYADPYL